MIHCILGHGASGKTTVQNYLKKLIPAITTYTTRPIRHNETEGIHYHFLDNEKFVQKIKDHFFVEYYYIKKNDWYYGLSLDEIDYQNKDYTLVIDPNGYKTLLDKIGKEYLKCYYINLSENERAKRMLNRKDNIDEIFRRIFSDRKDFEDFEKYADLILSSKDSKQNSNAILEQIKERAF
jgi:guanylate kinase